MPDQEKHSSKQPGCRPRRLRQSSGIRRMLQQVSVTASDLICPVFVHHGENIRQEISSMPGQYQVSVDQLKQEAEEIQQLGIPAVILFGIPESKDVRGSDAYSDQGIIQRATRMIKAACPELVVITDLCLCEYTSHGHCGIINHDLDSPSPQQSPETILNDETLEVLGRIAVSQANAGSDVVAPSGMMDGMVRSIRQALDKSGWTGISIMSYSVKYASAFYGPFRDAADGVPQFGDRRTHQMDPANLQQAFLESRLDVEEGADFLMVKPALAYLDILTRLKQNHPDLPLVAYNVSGEYAMIKAAARNGWLEEQGVVEETLLGIKRAGADLIITYHAKDFVRWQNP